MWQKITQWNMKIVFIFRLFGKSAWTVKNPNRSRYVMLGFGWVGFYVLLTLISVISRLGRWRYSIFEIELARPGFELRTSRARAGHTAFRYTCIFVLEDFNIDFLELEPSTPALLRLCIVFCVRRRVAVARYRMICLVLLNFFTDDLNCFITYHCW